MTEDEAQAILLGPPLPPQEAYVAFRAWYSEWTKDDANPAGLDKIKPCLIDAFVAGWMSGLHRRSR